MLVNEPGATPGYTLFAPNFLGGTYLIDNDGQVVHSWNSGFGWSSYLLPDGSLMRASFLGPNPRFTAGGGSGSVKEFDWDGSLTWQFDYSSTDYMAHHDIEPLPNGNVLVIAWEYESGADAIAAGRDPNLLRDGELWPDKIVEVEPTGPTTGNIVWEWRVWDHLVQDFDATKDNFSTVADHPELVNVNYFSSSQPATGEADWMHSNQVAYNPELDQVALSVRHFNELWIIDHSTTPAEAAGHSGGNSGKGGDLLYRWGNPQAYDAGSAADQQLFLQHDAEWIPPGYPGAGDITIFNNGRRPDGSYSSIDQIAPPVDVNGNYALTPGQAYGPAAPVWRYVAAPPGSFYSSIQGSAQRLWTGNTLVTSSIPGTIFEVDVTGTLVWKYVNPIATGGPIGRGDPAAGNPVFRANRYPIDYPGFQGRDLTPTGVLEIIDSDGDGLLNLDELKIYETDPHASDTDSDGLSDGYEVFDSHTEPGVRDTDGDGCPDGRELGPNENLGGRRDPLNPWDYFNPGGDGVNTIADLALLLNNYAKAAGDPGYQPRFDRVYVGPLPWNLGPPDGKITMADILLMIFQYRHNCS